MDKRRRPLTAEHKRKISEANLGHKDRVPPEARKRAGKKIIGNNWNVGKPQSEESRRKKSIALRGEKSHLWRGGITSTYRQRRKEKTRENGGYHTLSEWETLKAQYNWTCQCCKKSEPEIKLTKDHIIPVLKGGSNNIENIQPLCQVCNSRKRTQIIKYI